MDQLLQALKAAVGDFAYLLGVEIFPTIAVEVLIKWHDEHGIDEVDERVAHVAVVLWVNGQVEKIPFAGVQPVHLLEQHLLRVLVRDVPNHQRCARVVPAQDAPKVDGVRLLVDLGFLRVNIFCAVVAEVSGVAWHELILGVRVLASVARRLEGPVTGLACLPVGLDRLLLSEARLVLREASQLSVSFLELLGCSLLSEERELSEKGFVR